MKVRSRRIGSLRTRITNRGCAGSFVLILDRGRAGAFLESFESFAHRTSLMGALNSITQLVLKAMQPGVPDFYQGTETWDLSLVDPDNRRAVDFASRRALLAGDTEAAPDWNGLAARWRDGRDQVRA